MDIDRYLARLDYHGPLQANLETFTALHLAHLRTIPFENFDIHLGRPIRLSLPDVFIKVVDQRRGGFCYELNSLFGWLLETIGFDVTFLSARVYSDGEPGPEFDHLLLQVSLDEKFIADVGFGDNFFRPLHLDTDSEQIQDGFAYRLIDSNLGKRLQRNNDTGMEPLYTFTLSPRNIDDFTDMCHFQQNSPESSFAQKTICSLATATGRVTLSNRVFIQTENGKRVETVIESADNYRQLLKDRFDIVFSDNEINTLFTSRMGGPACPPE